MQITVKEFARAAGVSTQAVYSRLQSDLQQFARVENGKKTIDSAALELFKKQESAGECASDLQALDKLQIALQAALQEVDKLQSALHEAETKAAALQAEKEAMQANLDDLRQQIDGLQRDKQELQERLKEAHILTANAQQQARLLTDGQQRRGLFARIFNRGKDDGQ